MSGVYGEERFFPEGAVSLDFSALEGTCCYCDADSQRAIRNALERFSPRGIHWIDSGDYHYLTYFWLEKLREPFDLLLVDNHTDDQSAAFGEEILSCGGWVATARKSIPLLRNVYFTRDCAPIESLQRDGLPLYVSLDKDAFDPEFAATNWNQGNASPQDFEKLLRSIRRKIAGIDICGEISSNKGATLENFNLNRELNCKLQELFVDLLTE